ncbi:hypothetical protein [Streptomyces acidiscabies]|uniref:Secreted protein n=1 Tax=Streptomyces acidiscabies TaxID=42234 RepID=A0AAP6BAK4_9ACTN|nr:hypothetical protein [Streptomyces acidiscabies]MBZ3916478.1 hypothetical protein [Streptomyces acidiscabies]MDX2961149.1 hypothetical protein [Streptomyces acidiscabies]MDX3022897.1 hypothetical protein [Streptomyces acidiscabies]MDX3791856.1 hypothetical protein [Streptomyces acidiscabies]GAQ59391.1 hypothetical protein a10_09293 [Streptomyces acidiscabies]
MRVKIRRRGASMAAVAALSAGGLVLATAGSASASSLLTVQVGAAVFVSTNLASGTVGVPDLWSGDQLLTNCWSTGQNLGRGNIWYHTLDERYAHLGGLELTVTGWTYAPYVDNSAAANGSIPHC